MPLVVFEPPLGDPSPSVEVAAPDGGALVDVCDDSGVGVPFSCRAANCGTCRVEVLEGASELLPPKDDELDVLELLEGPPTVRLACQAKMKPGLTRLRVRPIGDRS